MKKALKWALIPVAVVAAVPLLLLAALLFCFPIRYKVFAKIDESKDVRAKISYLFGFVRYKYSLVSCEASEISPDGYKTDESLWLLWHRFKPRPAIRKKAPGREIKISDIFSFLLETGKKEAIERGDDTTNMLTNLKDILTYGDFKTIIKDSLKTIKKLALAIRPKYIRIEGEFGLSDPADTAFLYGGYEAAAHILGIRKNVSLLPIFNNETKILRLDVDVKGQVNIYRLVAPVVRLLFTKPIRDLILKGDSNE